MKDAVEVLIIWHSSLSCVITGERTKHGPQVHEPGLSKYGPSLWTLFMDQVNGHPIFTTTKLPKKMNSLYYFKKY